MEEKRKEEARKMEEGREEKRKDGINGRGGGRVKKELEREEWLGN